MRSVNIHRLLIAMSSDNITAAVYSYSSDDGVWHIIINYNLPTTYYIIKYV